MSANDPQVLYMILIVPSLFGLTLIGEGINKLVHEESNGVVSVIFGFLFVGVVIFAYVFFSSYMVAGKGI